MLFSGSAKYMPKCFFFYKNVVIIIIIIIFIILEFADNSLSISSISAPLDLSTNSGLHNSYVAIPSTLSLATSNTNCESYGTCIKLQPTETQASEQAITKTGSLPIPINFMSSALSTERNPFNSIHVSTAITTTVTPSMPSTKEAPTGKASNVVIIAVVAIIAIIIAVLLVFLFIFFVFRRRRSSSQSTGRKIPYTREGYSNGQLAVVIEMNSYHDSTSLDEIVHSTEASSQTIQLDGCNDLDRNNEEVLVN